MTDVHKELASRMYGIPAEEVTALQRNTAKRLNFFMQYSQPPIDARQFNREDLLAMTMKFRRFDTWKDTLPPFRTGRVHTCEPLDDGSPSCGRP